MLMINTVNSAINVTGRAMAMRSGSAWTRSDVDDAAYLSNLGLDVCICSCITQVVFIDQQCKSSALCGVHLQLHNSGGLHA
mmetsp:Transcript_17788/g.50647  ORF Transcript_17788/g.50647 Transcript_17788/m.50647 type:complete len:81 (+) Transcript_17788:167-409(+)